MFGQCRLQVRLLVRMFSIPTEIRRFPILKFHFATTMVKWREEEKFSHPSESYLYFQVMCFIYYKYLQQNASNVNIVKVMRDGVQIQHDIFNIKLVFFATCRSMINEKPRFCRNWLLLLVLNQLQKKTWQTLGKETGKIVTQTSYYKKY